MVILILIDGLTYPVFERLLGEGRLPNIQRALLERLPGVAGPALTTFPSTTAPLLGELLSGKYCDRFTRSPRRIHAFDRETGEALRYEFQPTAWRGEPGDLFDLARRMGHETLSFFKGDIGAARSHRNELLYNLDAITDYSSLAIFNYDGSSITELIRTLQRSKRRFPLTFLYLTTVDLNGHFHGPESRQYSQATEEIDRHLGHLFGAMAELPGEGKGSLLDETSFVLFGDHGMMTSGHHIDLAQIFQGFGLAAADIGRVSTMVRTRLRTRWWEEFDLLVVPSGSSVANLHVRRPGEERRPHWREEARFSDLRTYPGRLDPIFRLDLLRLLQAHHGLDLVMAAEAPSCIRVIAPGGAQARILQRGGSIGSGSFAYQLLRPEDPAGGEEPMDPLRYLQEEVAADLITREPDLGPANLEDSRFDEAFHPLDRWLDATWQSQRPGAVPLIPKAFAPHSTRSEVVVTTRRGFGFMRLTNGDHGDLSRDSILAPLVLAGPRIDPKAELGAFRLMDLLPILLELLEVPEELRPTDLDARRRPDLLR